jgi:hypothetical protein
MGSTVSEREPATVLTSDGRGGKYLVFELGTEEFGIRVLTVREIMGIQNVTAVPQTPVHVKGVVNLAAADIEDTPDFWRWQDAVLSAGDGQSKREGQNSAGDRPRAEQAGSGRHCAADSVKEPELEESSNEYDDR